MKNIYVLFTGLIWLFAGLLYAKAGTPGHSPYPERAAGAAAPTFTYTKTDVTTCNGATTGSITVTASGGAGNYTYSKDNGANFQAGNQFTNLAAGTYQVLVKDGSNVQSAAQAVTISQPDALTGRATSVTSTCPGLSTGAISFTAGGGTAPYQYAINNGTYQSSNVFTGLAAGNYLLSVRDANGCVISPAYYQVTAPTAPTVTPVVTDVSCSGRQDGAIRVDLTGGVNQGATTISIDNGATYINNTVFSALSAGTYKIIVKYANNCLTPVKEATVNQPTALSFTTQITGTISCNGGQTGAIQVTASGGTGAYQYSKDNGASYQASNQFNELSANTYRITVTDSRNCPTAVQRVTISQPTELAYTVSKTDVTCFGARNGTVTVDAQGGTSPYQYVINMEGQEPTDGGNPRPGTSGRQFTNLATGSYYVTITDANGCSVRPSLDILQPEALVFETSTSAVLCNGGSSGRITVTASGGTGPYQYSKDNGTTYQSASQFGNVVAGVYSIVVKDANNCVSPAQSVTVTQPAALAFTTSKTDAVCAGGNTGSIVITASGGTGPYQYSKDNGSTFQSGNSFTGLTAGTYQVLVRDANNCVSAAQSVSVGQPAALTFTTTKTDVAGCNGDNTGSITATVNGGTGAYQYSKDNGATFQTSNSFSGLSAGSYPIVVKDANGCVSAAQSIVINQPPTLAFSTNATNVSCFSGTNGSITFTASGGTGAYQYSITNGRSFQASNSFTGLAAGAYPVLTKDANGCLAEGPTVIISQPSALVLTIEQANVNCNGAATGTIVAGASGGTPAYQYSKDNGATYQGGSQFNSLTAGTYSIRIKDANNCLSGTQSVNITQPTALSLSAAQTNVTTCFGGNNGSLTLTATGGTGAYQYSKDNGASFQSTNTFTGLAAGSYQVLVKDANNCVSTAQTLVITQPTAVSFTTTKTDVTSCNGATTGSIVITASGGTGAYQYSKDNGTSFQTSNSFTGLGANSYQVVVKDANGCLAPVQTVVINQPSPIEGSVVSTTQTCPGLSTGGLTASASGGTAPYQYALNNGTYQSGNVFTGLAVGDYTLSVKDANGCIYNKTTYQITAPTAPTVTPNVTNLTCNGVPNGAIYVGTSGGVNVGQLYASINNGATYTTNIQFNNLAAGTYQVLVKYANNCSTPVQAVTVTQPASVSFNTSVTSSIKCYGDITGAIAVTATGGTAPYQYSKDNGASYQDGNLFGELAAGTYPIVVKDANGCITPARQVVLSQPTELAYTVSKTDVTCFGARNGTVTVDAQGGTSPYQYVINMEGQEPTDGGNPRPGTSGRQFTNLATGSYYVTITDANGCSVRPSLDILQPEALVFETSTSAVLCNGGSSGRITVTASGGTGPYQYSKDNGTTYQSASQFDNVAAGVYSIVVKDANNCVSPAQSVTVVQPAVLTASTSKSNVTTCFGGNSGSISITASGGTAPYQYSKDNGGTFQPGNSFASLTAGTYAMVVKDANGCVTAAQNVTIDQPAAVSFTTTKVNVSGCYGDNTGSITVTASGGTGAYQYSKDNGTTFQVANQFAALPAGSYQVVVKDANGCASAAQTVVITQPALLTYTTAVTNVSCYGGTNGSIMVTASGGTAPYQYSKDNGATYQASNSFTGLGATSYQVVVKDTSGCRLEALAISITQPDVLSLTAESINLSCNGAATGSITVTGSGGVPAYQYSKDNGATYQAGNQFAGLTAGTYSVRIKDANGCVSGVRSVGLTQPAALSLSVDRTNVTSCNGDATGSLSLTASGGTGAYQYSKDNGASFQTSNQFGSLTAGVYAVLAKDANGCLSPAQSVTISQPSALSLSVVATDTRCFGENTGALTITASGGTGPYSYTHDRTEGFQTSNRFENLRPGVYNVRVRDANGCVSGVQSVTINQPQPLTFTASQTNVACAGTSTGSIVVTGSGGTTPYQYSKDNGATYQASNQFTGLGAGTYSVLVKDANSCVTTAQSITITQPDVLSLTAESINPRCNGAATGSITVTGSGGVPAYQYSKDNGATYQASNQFTGLTAGTYSVRIKDTNGCVSGVRSVILTQPTALSLSVARTNVTSCNGDATGSLSLTASGGTGAYQYSKDNGASFQTSNQFGSLTAGVYAVLAKDANGCLSPAQSVTISQPSALSLSVVATDTRCFGENTGALTITASGGTAPYSYTHDRTEGFRTSNRFENLSPGGYNVRVRDANGCVSAVQSVTINQPDVLTMRASSLPVTCFGNSTGSISVTANGGTTPYQYSKDNGASFQSASQFTGLGVGTYSVIVKDANNCVTTTQSISVTQPAALAVTISKTDIVSCLDGNTGTISLSATGGTTPYQYSKDNGATYQAANSFANLSAGVYQIVVKDANSCVTAAQSVTIAQPQAITLRLAKTNVTSCNGDATGSLSLTASGGTGAYQYSKDNGASFQTSNQFGSLTAGVYAVLAKDANGCLSPAQSVTISQPSALSLSVVATDTRCFGENTGALTITASGGTAPYSYTHDRTEGFRTSNRFENLSAGEYKVRVQDANGCVSVVQSVTINQPQPLTFVTSQTNISCAGTTTGSISFSATGGTGAYQYSIDNGNRFQAGAQFTNLPAGSYPVLVKDANGCLSEAPAVVLTQPAILAVTASKTNIVSCSDGNTGTISLSATGGTTPYRYSKDNGATYQESPQFAGLSAGPYRLVVNDANGCQMPVSVTIVSPCCLSATANPATIAYGQSTTLTATGCSGTISWTGGPQNSNVYVVSPTKTTSYTATCSIPTSGSPVTCTSVVTVTVNQPVCTLTTSASPTTITNGQSTTLTASGCTGTVSWNGGPQNSNMYVVNPTQTTSYTATCSIPTSSSPVTCTSVVTVTVNQPVCALTTSASPATITNGQSATLTASGCSGTINWQGFEQNGPTIVVNPTQTTSYTATCNIPTSGSPVTCTSVVTVTVNQPVCTLTTSASPTTITNGQSTTLTASGCTGTVSWNGGPQNSNVYVVNPAQTTTYTATCTIATSGSPVTCQSTVTVTVNQPVCALTTSASPTTITNGQRSTLTASGCIGTVNWTGGPTNSTVYVVNPTQTTSYTATCTIATSGSPVTCTSVVTVAVTQQIVCALTTTANPTTITNGQSATLTASGCTGTVNWRNGPSNAAVYVVAPTQTTSYTATCSMPTSGDPVTCTSVVTVVVNQPVCAIAAQASSNAIFNGQSVTLTTTGCANGTISWSGSSQTGSTLIVNLATTTTYVATCTIPTSGSPVICTAPVSVTVVNRPECTLQVQGNPSTVFAGDPVTLTATGCNGTLKWSSGQSESVITVTPTQTTTYDVTCTTSTPAGSVSCPATTTVTVIAKPVCNLSLQASPTAIFNGQSAALTASGCEGGTISWNSQAGGGSRIIVSPTATTTYSATCTFTTLAGSVSCTAPVTVTVTQPMLQIAGSGDVLPLNAVTWAGTVTQNVGPFVWQYKTPTGDWQNFPTTFDNNPSILVSATSFLGSAAPTLINQAIQLRAFSPYLISNVLTVTIRQQNPTIASLVTTKALCANTATGSFTLTVGRNLEPGESAFRAQVFALTNGAETVAATYTFTGTTFVSPAVFAKGAYRVRLQSSIGSGSSAESTQDFTIEDAPALTLTATKTDILCFGGTNGTINLVASGGAGPYQYAVNGGSFQPFQAATQQQIANLAAGVYSVQLRDNNACSSAQPVSVTIAQPTASLTITRGTVKNPTGFQVNDGTITLQVTGGTPDYSFAWSVPNPAVSTQPTTQGVTHTITSLGDGNYTVVVTDKAGCTTQASYSLTQPNSILAKTTIVKAISCAGGANGIIQVDASGGVPRLSGDAYSYDWKIKGSTTSISQTNRLTNATSTTYTVTVTDGNGVAKAFDVYLPEPLPVAVSVTSLTNVACFGTATGGVSLSIQGGVAPYSTRWNTQQTGLALANMQAGRYVAVVTDANACQAQASVQIQQPQALSATLASVNPSCYDICNGQLAATLTGGTAPYVVTWQNSASQALSLTGLCSGSYTVNIKDANGCAVTQTTSLTRPVQKQIVLRTNTFICRGQTVDLDATIADGVSYAWTYPDGTTRTTPVVSVTSAGKYQVTATDKNGCTVTAQTSLSASETQAPTLAFAVASQIGVGEPLIAVNITNPRPTQTSWTIPASASLVSSSDDRLELVFKNTGTYPITMNGVQGQCEFKTTKMVTAVPASTVVTTAQTTPFIQELTILPNPNSGTFKVRIRLADVSDVKIRVKPLLSTGTDIYQQSAAGQQDYELSVSIPVQNLQTGNYLLTLETAKAIQTVKLLIVL